jgi:hypothetical protein
MNEDDKIFTSDATPAPETPAVRIGAVRSAPTPKPLKSPKSSVHSDDEEEDLESVNESEDDDDEDDSIIAPDDEIEVEEGEVPNDDEESLKAHAEMLAQEAAKFIKSELKSDVVGGRSLRKRAEIKKPDDSHHKIIAAAFLLDEKKEIIKEVNIWKKKLCLEAAERNVVFPRLDVKMCIDHLREEHHKVRDALGLEVSSDEEEEEEEEDDESSAEIEEDEDESETESSEMEEDD